MYKRLSHSEQESSSKCAFWAQWVLVWRREKKNRQPKHDAGERRAIYRLTPVLETALPLCLGSALHMSERRKEEEVGS